MVVVEAEAAWQDFLGECCRRYAVFRDATNKLAMAGVWPPSADPSQTDEVCSDCLRSLSLVANQPGYTKPVITDDVDVLQVVEGRHPMVEAVRSDPFVPNTIMMGGVGTSLHPSPSSC